jgi:hypothetical protein
MNPVHGAVHREQTVPPPAFHLASGIDLTPITWKATPLQNNNMRRSRDELRTENTGADHAAESLLSSPGGRVATSAPKLQQVAVHRISPEWMIPQWSTGTQAMFEMSAGADGVLSVPWLPLRGPSPLPARCISTPPLILMQPRSAPCCGGSAAGCCVSPSATAASLPRPPPTRAHRARAARPARRADALAATSQASLRWRIRSAFQAARPRPARTPRRVRLRVRSVPMVGLDRRSVRPELPLRSDPELINHP